MQHHTVKAWPEFFLAVAEGVKTFDLRRDDRHYQVGDLFTLREWDPKIQSYTGRQVTRKIVYMLEGRDTSWSDGEITPLHGLRAGYAILGLAAP